MPSEADLRALLGNAVPDVPPVDADAIVRKSRRRRLPRQLAVGGTVALAAAGIGVASFTGLGIGRDAPVDSATSAADQSAGSEAGTTPESAAGIQGAPADRLNLCGGPLAEVAPSETGLVLTPVFPAAIPPATPTAPDLGVSGSAVLTNNGTTRVTGTTAASPAITISRDGIVLWHGNGPTTAIAVQVDLDPGESMEYPASFTPVRCDVEDDLGDAFRADLPPLESGTYSVSAAIDLTPDSPAESTPTSASLITGPATPITIG